MAIGPHYYQSLISLLDPIVRSNAFEALGDIEDPRVVDALIRALEDEDAYVRQAASDALKRNLKDPRAWDALSKEFLDPNDPKVRKVPKSSAKSEEATEDDSLAGWASGKTGWWENVMETSESTAQEDIASQVIGK